MKSGDEVTIVNDKVLKLYGINKETKFTVKDVNGSIVKLNNGWGVKVGDLKLPVPSNENKSDDTLRKVLSPVDFREIVNKTITDMLFHGGSFTAYDVTSMLRNDFPDIEIKYEEVRRIVKYTMENYSSYNCVLNDNNIMVYEPHNNNSSSDDNCKTVTSVDLDSLIKDKVDYYIVNELAFTINDIMDSLTKDDNQLSVDEKEVVRIVSRLMVDVDNAEYSMVLFDYNHNSGDDLYVYFPSDRNISLYNIGDGPQLLDFKDDDFDMRGAIESEIKVCVREDVSFTAFDITKTLRKKFPNEDIKHHIVKGIVHSTMDDGKYSNYDKKLTDVGSDVQPWLYYKAKVDNIHVCPSVITVTKLAETTEVDEKENCFVKILKKLSRKV